MCIIIVKPAGVNMPPRAIIDRCANLNPHGFGFATRNRVYKTLSHQDFRRELNSISRDEAAILHFRYATHGSIKTDNCHPFNDKATGVSFAHNGILNIVPRNDMTDSETAFRDLIAPVIHEYGLFSDETASAVYEIIGGSRFAFIDTAGEFRIFGQFLLYHGCWYSNRNFMTYAQRANVGND